MTSTPFTLHPRLAADCAHVTAGPLSELLLMRDAGYPWFVLVPRRAGLRELCELAAPDQALWLAESNALSCHLLKHHGADKLNVAALGNQVPQLHIHYIARYVGDPAWPGPVWGARPPQPYSPAALAARIEAAREAFAALD